MIKKTIPLILAVLFLLPGCSYFSFLGLGQSPETKAGIKMLEEMIRQGNPKEEIRNFASAALFIIGGEKARDTLKEAFDKTKNAVIQTCLCLSMASTGTPDDIYFLMKILEYGNDKEDNKAAASAFLSLVVLKPDRTIKEIKLNSGSGAKMDSKWKELFLLSMNLGSQEPPQMEAAGPEDKIILT